MEYKNTELINKRFVKSNQTLLKALDDIQKLDITDENYGRKFEAISQLYKQVVEDAKNETTRIVEGERLRVEEERTEMEKVLESEKLEDDRKKTFWSNLFDGIKIAVSATVGIGGIAAGIWKFKRSTEKEKDDAYLTMTDKETVREGLREPTEKKWKFW